MSIDHLPDVAAPRDDLALVELSIQDARESLPDDRDRIAYHLREAAQLLDAVAETVYIVPTAQSRGDYYHLDRDCRHLDGAEVRAISVAQLGDRECCGACAGDAPSRGDPDWAAYRALRDRGAER